MRTKDLIYEGADDLEMLIGSYWHLVESFEKAIECENPDCHHAKVDKGFLKSAYDRQLAELCHQLMDLIQRVA